MKQVNFFSIFFLMLLIAFKKGSSQSHNGFYKYKSEIGTNVTAILGNLLSITPQNNQIPYGFSYARHYNKICLRLGANVFYEQSQDIQNGSFRTLTDNNVGIKFSVEKYYNMHKNFMLHYGIDFLGSYNTSYSTVDNVFSNTNNLIGGGAGPALRIVYKLNDKMSLLTESTFYGTIQQNHAKSVLNGVLFSESKKTLYNYKFSVPVSLYFFIHF